MATTAKVRGFDEVLRFMEHREGDRDRLRVGVRVRIVEADELDEVRAIGPWSSTALEDGRLLAVTLVDAKIDSDHERRCRKLMKPLGVHHLYEAENLDWCEDARRLRGLLMAFMETLPGMTWLALDVGGNGTGTFTMEYGEARLTMAMGRDPSS